MDFRSSKCLALAFLLTVTPAFAMHSHHAKHRAGHHKVKAKAAHWKPGQREIDPDRVRSIQQALISRNYLSGDASGAWDDQTEAAMQKFQGDNGWQTRLMPDSRALIKLGLGPNGESVAVAQGNGTAGGSDPLAPATGSDTLAEAHSILN